MVIKLPKNPINVVFALKDHHGKAFIVIAVYTTIIYLLYSHFHWTALGMEGAIPIGVFGTALAIFLGFRNNNAYD